ncbi:DoxX family protein [Agromyces seonyuensis]|uniref:DoxX family membrane protein n=1 Tax=Agromyces seonyuensis TaxID=2662446 RepID=A0A6I4NVB4_9MICO|nr:DoxX family protein [Agromyces seonyuensis]MWB97022.1 DoxX family membrane protein [Agromyces seonyuensis]
MSTSIAPTPGIQPVGHRPVPVVVAGILDRGARAEAALKAFLERWSIAALRVSLGAVFVAFGVLKFFPGVSPMDELVQSTWAALSFGLVTGYAALVVTAVMETAAGLLLISGKFARAGLVVLALCFVGILSPVVLFPAELVTETGPSLTGQYIAKNVVLIAAALVIASKALRGRTAR